MAEHHRLPTTTGVFLEASSVVAVAAARRLLCVDGMRRVVAVGTGTGLKGLPTDALRPPPTARPGLAALAESA